ncbi:DPP IV N-terminal domain-containing protein [Segetibacter sp.]|uniref:S9 family peptidase n=1 Tax=Segetibacter sp. TaxID=2231182 RepID=UPI00262CE879|nr:DPP IV N-terminal domain-containing protein [Segetibacter sp.]MCW3081828.1 dipeptidyl peptidase [Segetibacter sp.]
MKFFSLAIIVFYLSVPVFSQSGQNIQWTKNGSSFHNIEGNTIVEHKLPSFKKKVIVEAGQLTPKGQTKALSVRSFSFSEDGKKVLIFTNTKRVWRRDTRGDYWVLNMNNKRLTQIGKGRPASSLMFAKISPDGTKAAYISGHNVYVEDLVTNKIRPLTKDGTTRLINGTFDWAYEEEFDCRDGFRWSPDSKNIAFWQIDATKIKNFLLINNTDSLYSFTNPVEYPKVGQNPSPARIGVVNVSTAKTTWMKVPGDPVQHYIPRMEWAANSSQLVLQQLNRKQNESKVFLCNIASGVSNAIYSEQDKAWIDVKARWSDDPTGWEWINGGKEFLWISEKDGWRHMYRVGRDGKETKITKGNYDMISLEAIDEKNGVAYIMASPFNATQQYLYKVTLNGDGEAELLSPVAQKGTHSYNISPSGTYANHYFSNLTGEWVADWVGLPDHTTLVVNGKSEPRNTASRPAVEMFQVTTEDNVTMDGWMIKPKNFDSTKKYPVLFQVYSEPASMTVKDAQGSAGTSLYSGDMTADGYIQIGLDGRGTPAPKGAAWRKAIYRKIGIVNIRDQAMAARKISNWNFVDTSRIAVWGWSGGGSTTLNLLFQYPEIYKTGISIAPVANQLLYDNIYQERYMGLPQENREDYINGSPISHAKNLRGNLLIIHGTGDDNVHYQGTEILINELVKHGKNFQMMSYPNRTHSISEGEGTRAHLSKLFTSYLKKHCSGGGR